MIGILKGTFHILMKAGTICIQNVSHEGIHDFMIEMLLQGWRSGILNESEHRHGFKLAWVGVVAPS